MSKEMPPSSDGFSLTEQERLDERISQERFAAILTNEQTAVHHIEVAANDDGEFLFVTLGQPVGDDRKFLTFWGLGFDTLQKRWLTDEWRYGDTRQFLHQIPQKIAPEDALVWIKERLDTITPSLPPPIQ